MTTRTRCPVCDQVWTPPDLFVDLNTNTIFAGGAGVHVEPQIAEAMAYMIGRLPLPSTTDGLRDALWGRLDRPVEYQNSIHVYIWKLRRILAPRRFEIVQEGLHTYVIRRIRKPGPLPIALFTVGVAKSA